MSTLRKGMIIGGKDVATRMEAPCVAGVKVTPNRRWARQVTVKATLGVEFRGACCSARRSVA